MDAYFLCSTSKELEELALRLGYKRALFVDVHFVYSEVSCLKDAQKLVTHAHALGVPSVARITADCVREVVEKSKLSVVVGLEGMPVHDSLHQVRGGLDQVTTPLLCSRGVAVMFSFVDFLFDGSPRLLGRAKFNLELCSKYKVDTVITCLCTSKYDLRSVKDVEAFFRVVGK